MPGPDSGLSLIEAAIRGGEKAVLDFQQISGYDWFDYAPEYVLTTYVAMSIGKLDSTYALLEGSVYKTRLEARAVRPGNPAKHERRNGRFDIVVYWANDTPRGAIEVKSPICSVDERRIKPDIDELCASLKANKDSTFQFGAYVYYASVSAPQKKHDNASQKLRALASRIEEKGIDWAREHDLECTSVLGSVRRGENEAGEGEAWCIAVLVLTRKGGKSAFQGL